MTKREVIPCTRDYDHDMKFGRLFMRVLATGFRQPKHRLRICDMLDSLYLAHPKHFIINDELNDRFIEVGWRSF